MAGRGRRRRDPRLDRQLVPAPAQPGRRDLPVDVLGKTYEQLISSGTRHVPQLPAVPRRRSPASCSSKQWLDAGVPADQIEGLNLPDARAIKQAVDGAGDLHRRLPDGVGHPRRDHARRLRRASASRGRSSPTTTWCKQFAAGSDRAEQPVHLLQQVPRPRRRAPARLLRGEPLRRAARRCCAQVMSVFQPPPFA